MPVFDITSPDGTKYRVTAPEGATQDQALQRVMAQHQPAAPQKDTSVALSDDPNKEYGTVLPFAQDKRTGKNELAFPEIIRGPVQAADKLLQTAEGKRQMSPGEKGAAGLDVVGAMPAASVAGRTLKATPEMASALARKTGEVVERMKPGPAATVDSVSQGVQAAKESANQLYMDATAKGGVMKPGFTNTVVRKALAKLPSTEGLEAFEAGSDAAKLSDKLRTLYDQPLTLKMAQGLHEQFGDLIDKEIKPNGQLTKQGARVSEIQADVKDAISRASPNDIMGGAEGFQSLNEGRKAWSQAMKMSDIQRAVQNASNSDNPAVTLRQQLRSLLNNPNRTRGWSAPEKAALKQAMASGKVNDLMHKIGMSGAATVGASVGSMVGGFPIGTAAGAGAGALVSRAGQSAATGGQMRKVQSLMDLLGAGTPQP